MKLRSAPLDDVFDELLLALDQDGGRRAQIVRRIAIGTYRAHKIVMLTVRRLPWRRPELPDIGDLPFAPSDRELERAWREQ